MTVAGVLRRAWLVAVGLVAMVLLAYVSSPDAEIFGWSLAGPFALAALYPSESSWFAYVEAVVLLLLAAAHPVRPNGWTATVTAFVLAVWFVRGFGTVRMSV